MSSAPAYSLQCRVASPSIFNADIDSDIVGASISWYMDIVVLTYDIIVSTISYTPDIEVFNILYRSFCNIGYYDIEGQDYDIDGQYWDTISLFFGDLQYRRSVVPISVYKDIVV